MVEVLQKPVEIPQWVYDGSWQPLSLKLMRLVRRHLCLMLLCAILIFGKASWGTVFALPLSLLVDWAITKFSWISGLSPEAIYRWQITADKTRYSDAVIDTVTNNRQFSNFFFVTASFIAPFAVYKFLFSEHIEISKLFYLFFIVFMGSRFLLSLFYVTSDRANLPATPQKFVEDRGMLRIFSAEAVAMTSLVQVGPALFLFWVLVHSASGFGPMHLLAMSGCMVLVSFIYHSEYNISLQAVASRAMSEKEHLK